MTDKINASIVSLLTLSLQTLSRQLDNDEDFAGNDGENILNDLFDESCRLRRALNDYLDRMEDN